MLILLEIGRHHGVWGRPKESEGKRGGLGTVEGAVFSLFGLLIAFPFSGAGLIRLEIADQALVEVRAAMNG
jgi:hypothetical protein